MVVSWDVAAQIGTRRRTLKLYIQALAMTSLPLQNFQFSPVALQSKASPLQQSPRRRLPAPNRLQCRDYPPVPHCCPSRDHFALAGSWASLVSSVGNPCPSSVVPRLMSSSMARENQHGSMRGIINIDKPKNTKAKWSWCSNSSTGRQRGLPRWEFHRALAIKRPQACSSELDVCTSGNTEPAISN